MNFYEYEIWGKIFNALFIAMLLYYVIMTIPVIKQNFQSKHNNRWNMVLTVLSFCVVILLLILSYIDPDQFDPLLVYPWNYYGIFVFGAWTVICLITNAIGKAIIRRKKKKNGDNLEEIIRPVKLKLDVEVRRKLVHICTILFFLPFIIGPILYFYVGMYVYSPYPNLYSQAIINNVVAAGNMEPYALGAYASTTTLWVAFIGAIVIQYNGEIYHNRYPDYIYPLRKAFAKSLRKSEIGSYGSHISMTTGFFMASVIIFYNQPVSNMGLAINCFLAMILPSIWGDLFASAIGRRLGNKKWKFNPDKSYIGTLAGIIVTALTTYWFVGFWGSFIAVIVFILADIVFSKYNICDNYSFPVIIAIVYRLLIPTMTPMIVIFAL